MEKVFYFSKLVTVFGRVPAISFICFMCRISCEAIHLGKRKHSDGGPSRLLESMGQLQDARLSKRRAKDLQADRQLTVDLATWHGNARNPRQRSCNCIYISKIHLERISSTLAQFEGWNR